MVYPAPKGITHGLELFDHIMEVAAIQMAA